MPVNKAGKRHRTTEMRLLQMSYEHPGWVFAEVSFKQRGHNVFEWQLSKNLAAWKQCSSKTLWLKCIMCISICLSTPKICQMYSTVLSILINLWMRSIYSLELAEDICILSRDARGLKHCDPEGEVASDFQMLEWFFLSHIKRKFQTTLQRTVRNIRRG